MSPDQRPSLPRRTCLAAGAVLTGWAGGGCVYGLWVSIRMGLSDRIANNFLLMVYVGLAFGLLGLGLLGLRALIRAGLQRIRKTSQADASPARSFAERTLAACGGFVMTFCLLLVVGDLLLTLAFQPDTPRWWLFTRAGLTLLAGAGISALLIGPAGRALARRLARAGRWPLVVALTLVLGLALIEPLLSPESSGAAETRTDRPVVPEETGRRVVLMGLDGATWTVIDPLIEAGRLPTIAALRRRGARGTPVSPPPMASPITWTTIVTGQPPAVHGISEYLLVAMPGLTPFPFEALARDPTILPFSFVALAYFLAGTASGIPPTSDRVQVPPIWRMLAAAGRASLVLGIPCTWPAQASPGLIVSDRYGPNEFDLFSHQDGPPPRRLWPEEAEARILPMVVDSKGDPGPMLERLGGFDRKQIDELARWTYNPMIPEPLRLLTDIYDADLTFMNILEHELADGRYLFATILVNGLDMTMHAFWAERFPEDFGRAKAGHPAWGTLIDAYHQMVDARLARIIAAAGPDTIVILLSDSGMAPSPGNLIWPGWHAPDAFFLAVGGPILPGIELNSIRYEDVVPTILYLLGVPVADDLPGRVLKEMIDPAYLEAHPVRTIASYR